ncbi:MAG: FtsQ-type POTRA domain-containing protein [Spirulinaceae cyanobacterium RM2_2_10]|nr:FtsQ-type POTRA domain-containing protein [Spirulinaceae cyanobacterium SM2_1_0]NJO19903.1 FtsQ-type POTRA domain-containing protein [Spirulinaceae cyanobacterium RM2_2_10]
MSSIASVSPADLKSRRQKLKRRRQLRILQAIWRSLLVGSLIGSTIWISTRPAWTIRHADQIDIEGNELLDAATIRSLIPIDYPQRLFQLQPQVLSEQIAANVPIAEATVTRKLLPPGLTITVQERQPVAVALIEGEPDEAGHKQTTVGLVDEQGVWLPREHYAALEASAKSPKLVVVGLDAAYRDYWADLYEAVSQARLEIFEIDLRDPNNLLLETELGLVHLGAYSRHQFPEQLEVLAQMRELPTHIESDRIAYIDLKVPQSPSIQLRQ